MKEKGQVFTLDMFFAISLTALILSYSGFAFEQARRSAELYTSRYTLERIANDAAEALVLSPGKPENWEENIFTLQVLGFANYENENSVPNSLNLKKFVWFRELCREKNWDPTRDEIQAIKALFGGRENFEIKLLHGENVLWDVWPRWDGENSSNVENSLEVVTVKRLLVKPVFQSVRSAKQGLQHLTAQPGGKYYTLDFYVYPGELEIFDWYVLIFPSGSVQPTVKIWVNRQNGNADYSFPPLPENNSYKMRYHGEDYCDNALTDKENGENTNNYLYIKVTGNPSQWVDVYVLFLPRCTPASLGPEIYATVPLTLEVKVWR